jgi:hypothetical protein
VNELASRLRAQPEGDLTLAVGAVAIGIGATLAFERMQGPWAKFPLLLLLAVPCALLFLLALSTGRGGDSIGTSADGRLAPWQTACLLVALILLYGSILQLVSVLGKDHAGTGTQTWVFALIGLCALAIAARLQSPGAALLAALFFGAAALTAINWIDSNAKIASYRDVLLLEGLLFLAVARMIWNPRLADAKLLVGLGGVGLIAGAVLGNQGNPFAQLALSDDGLIPLHSKDGWVLVLIVVTISLLAFAAWQRHGPSAFVGLVGFSAFFTFTQGGDLSGWPLILGIVTVICLAWALIVRPSRQQPAAGAMAHAPQPPPS